MQNTTNLNLKKPEYTDFADIQDINDNMDTLDDAIHDTQNSVATFTSSDVADGSATSWTTVTKVDSGETHKSIFAKMSQMFKNIRYLYKMLGTTDISSIGTGTVTNALSVLNAKKIGNVDATERSLLCYVNVMSLAGGETKQFTIDYPSAAFTAAPYVFVEPMIWTVPESLGTVVLQATTSAATIRVKNNSSTALSNISVNVLIIGAV